MDRNLKCGDFVRIEREFLGNPIGMLGLVYEEYEDFDDSNLTGVSIILENGVDLGGFSNKEQKEFLTFVTESNFHYKFENVIKLHNDFMYTPYFRIFFNKVKKEYEK